MSNSMAESYDAHVKEYKKYLHRIRSREWARKNPERVKESIAKWKKANPERVWDHNRKNYSKNGAERAREWRLKTPETSKENNRRNSTARRARLAKSSIKE